MEKPVATVLIVDDDVDFRNTLKEIVTREGLNTVEAGSGPEGLDALVRESPDLVLLDLVLPGMDGLETMREMRKVAPRTKIILVTAFATIENAVKSMKMGATDYLPKPFNIADFVMLLRRTLEELRFEKDPRLLQLDPIFVSLSNPIRRTVVELLGHHSHLRLTEIMRALNITDHAKVTFHLKNMQENSIIEKRADRTYRLSSKGRHVLQCLQQLNCRLPSP